MKADMQKPDERISELQSQMPSLIEKMRALRPEYRPVECYYALPALRAKIALLFHVLMSVEPKELMNLIEDSKLDGTKEYLVAYGALVMLEKEYEAVARNWFEENTLMGP